MVSRFWVSAAGLLAVRAQGRKRQLAHLAGSLLLGAVDTKTGGVERVDADVVAVGGVDDRAEPRLLRVGDRQPLAEVEDRLAAGQLAQRVDQREQSKHRGPALSFVELRLVGALHALEHGDDRAPSAGRPPVFGFGNPASVLPASAALAVAASTHGPTTPSSGLISRFIDEVAAVPSVSTATPSSRLSVVYGWMVRSVMSVRKTPTSSPGALV